MMDVGGFFFDFEVVRTDLTEMLPRRPCKLQKSTWNERTLSEVRKKDKKKRKAQKQWGISA